jgi:Peptidase A4 family
MKVQRLWTALVAAVVVFSIGVLYANFNLNEAVVPTLHRTPTHLGHPLVAVPSAAQQATSASAGPLGCPLPADQCLGSYNWGGYGVYNPSILVTEVTGSWVVPYIVGSHGQYCPDSQGTWDSNAVWVGIDGFAATDPTVEQTGTSSDCFYGRVSYYAWFEFYPGPSAVSTNVVKPGDHITATFQYFAGAYTTTLVDVTQRWIFTSGPTVVAEAMGQSAEWIDESPAFSIAASALNILGLTHVTQITFTDAYATINGHAGSITSFGSNVYWIVMVDFNFPNVSPPSLYYAKALPLYFSRGGSEFSVDWLSDGP